MDIIRADITQDNKAIIQAAADVLDQGGVIVFPTDSIYGLAANALNWQAVEKVFRIKQLEFSKPLPIVARNMAWVRELAHVTPKEEAILDKIWPGTATVVLSKKTIIPDIVTADQNSVGIRVPNYSLVDELLAKYGYPLTMISANISDETSQRINDVIAAFRGNEIQPNLVIDVGILPPSEPSTILDLTGDHPKIIRVGAATPQKLMELLKL